MIERILSRTVRGVAKSVLLLGPRQCGKTTLATSLSPDLSLNLMHEPTFLALASNPAELEQRLAVLPQGSTVLLDEVQRLPSLLNTIQTVIDAKRQLRFLLTGSSARKLRRGQANLLPGRLISLQMGPLVSAELGYELDTRKALSIGTLPGIWTEQNALEREMVLRSYAATYLKEEVQAEALTRNLEGFARFLYTAAQWSGMFLDLSKMASSAQITRGSAIRFFEVLEDCLIVIRVEAFSQNVMPRLKQHPRFYFFDMGVLNGLLGNFQPSPDRMGNLFEQLVATQIYHSAAAHGRHLKLSTFRTSGGCEVDLIIELDGEVIAVEVKASTNVGAADLRGLEGFANHYRKQHRAQVWYMGTVAKRIGNVDVLPWQMGLRQLGL